MDKILKRLAKLEAAGWIKFFHVKREGKHDIVKITVVDNRKSKSKFYIRNKEGYLIHVIRCNFWTNKYTAHQKWYHDVMFAGDGYEVMKLSESEIIKRLEAEIIRNRDKMERG